MNAKEIVSCAKSGCIRIQAVLAMQKQIDGKSDGVTLLPAEAVGLLAVVSVALQANGDSMIQDLTDEQAISFLADLPTTTK